MNDVPQPGWPSGGEPASGPDARDEPELHAGKWRVSLTDATTGDGPLVHLGHPDLVEEQGQMHPQEALALGIALIRQAAQALSPRPAEPRNASDDRRPEGTVQRDHPHA